MASQLSRSLLLILLITSIGHIHASEYKRERKLQSNSPLAMRIYVDYEDSDNQWIKSSLKDKYIFCKKIMERTKIYYSSVLLVNNRKENYTWSDVVVTDTKIVKGRTVPYDLWTYFTVYNKDDGSFAGAYPVEFDSTNGRPIVGTFELNLNPIVEVNSLGAIQYMGTFVHEFYHILVFNSELFPKFVDSNNKIIGQSNLLGTVTIGSKKSQTYKGPNVVNWARTYLGASSLTQLLIENDGGDGSAGSHWEHRYWPSDFMSAVDTRPNVLSALSMNMALDSGWFTVNDSFVEELEHGKNAGDIQASDCPTASMRGFCSTNHELSCAPDWMYKARCYTDETFTENCYFKWADVFCTVKDGDYGSLVDATVDNLGDTSRCVMASLSGGTAKPFCAKTSCSGTTSVTYTFGNGKTCTCTSANAGAAATCTDTSVSVTCLSSSEITDLCTRLQDTNRCPSDCNGKGICLGTSGSKRCFCIYGWMGNDCNTANLNETDAVVSSSNDSKNSNSSQIFHLVSAMILVCLALLN